MNLHVLCFLHWQVDSLPLCHLGFTCPIRVHSHKERWQPPFVFVNKVLFTSLYSFPYLLSLTAGMLQWCCWMPVMENIRTTKILPSLPPTSQTVTRAILQNHAMHIVSSLPRIFLNPHCSLVNLTLYESLNPLTPSHLYLWWPLSCDMCDSSVDLKPVHKVCNLHWWSGGLIFLHISKHWEDFGHLWFEGTGDEKTINTNHPWSFGGELRGKLVYRAWHLVKSSINASLFPYRPLTSCGSETRIMLLRGRRGSEEQRAAEAGRENCGEDNICFLFPRLGPPATLPVERFSIPYKQKGWFS